MANNETALKQNHELASNLVTKSLQNLNSAINGPNNGEVILNNNLTNNSAIATGNGMTNKSGNKVKIIKRYQNRKLYDTQQSCYVTLDDIAKMIRNTEEVMVVDNKTKRDITAATLTQIIFESEKKSGSYAPLYTLREVIQNQDGSISAYLAKLGAFPASHKTKISDQPAIIETNTKASAANASFDDVKAGLDQRIRSSAAANEFQANTADSDETLELPNSNNKTFDI